MWALSSDPSLMTIPGYSSRRQQEQCGVQQRERVSRAHEDRSSNPDYWIHMVDMAVLQNLKMTIAMCEGCCEFPSNRNAIAAVAGG